MVFLATLLAIACASSHGMAISIGRPVWARVNRENVVLSDCTGTQDANDVASEVSYFAGTPDSTPEDITTVTSGKHRDWAGTTTPAYFADTGVTFTSVLGGRGQAGDYAGTGNNGYGNFTCWQTDPTYLYTHDNRNCYAMYDCNHLGAAIALPSATPAVTPASTAPASTSTSASADLTQVSKGGLSVGAIVGLSIGVALGAIILAGIAGLLFWRRWKSTQQKKAAATAAADLHEKGPDVTSPGAMKTPAPVNMIWQGPGTRELESPAVYELPNHGRPVEMYGDAVAGELDATPTRAELHSHDLPPQYEYENAVSPGVYGNHKGPA
ncbi:hypothetical protein F5Y04DRAFT_262675 [Hypomontagnella monticulosa]|nr:hypothetical protein F5Y04DRAFT_262675 [Hypomontagnella monticulosa]